MTWLGDPAVWDQVKQQFPVGSSVTGTVYDVAPFGVFIDLGDGAIGLLRVPDMAGAVPKQMGDYPQAGEAVTVTVIGHDDRNRQVTLSQRA
jgi:small subunit ribosomal protein S1